jgi:UDP-glucuronate decarboxylase
MKGNGLAGISLAKTVIITGAAGFIGRALVERLLKEDLTTCIVAIDNGITGDLDALVKLTESGLVSASADGKIRTVLIRADIRDPKTWQIIIQSLDMAKFPPVREIYNLACPASPTAYTKFPVETLLTSVVGTTQALVFAEQLATTIWPELPPPRVVHVSTSEVYGDYLEGWSDGNPNDDGGPIPEYYCGSVAFRGPRACYAEGKRAAETLVHDFIAHSTHGLDVRTARLFNVYGPGFRQDDGRLVNVFLTAALEHKNLTIYGDGKQTRSLTYIDDAVQGLMDLMASPKARGAVVNVGDASGEITVYDLAVTVLGLLPETRSGLEYGPARPDEPRYRVPGIAMAMSLIGWAPKTKLLDGLTKTLEWTRQQQAKRREVKTMEELGVTEEKAEVVSRGDA